jgi:MoaA/NifB/PqqE/SkfB family radical SAM enzyme
MLDNAKKYLELFRMFFPGDPTYLVFYVTALCNSRCKTCFNWEYNNPHHRTEEELTLVEIEKIASRTGRLAYVTLGGGEPFLRADIADICKVFYDNNHARIFAIPTNCLDPKTIADQTKTILENCPEAVVRVSLSIDGIGEDHDSIRGVLGNFNKVEHTYELLNKLRERFNRLEILANTTFCIYNQDSIKEIHSYITSHFCLDMYSITLIRGKIENPDVMNVDLGKYQAATKIFEESYFCNKVKSRHPLQRLLSILPIFTRREVLKTATARRRTYTCHAVRKQIVVDSFGDVFACEMLPRKLGNLRDCDYALSTILQKPEVKELVSSIDRKECNCTWECAIQHSMVFNVKKWPRLFFEAFIK